LQHETHFGAIPTTNTAMIHTDPPALHATLVLSVSKVLV